MIVLHAAFYERSLLLWAESNQGKPPARARRNEPAHAWFDAGAAILLETLSGLGVDKRATSSAVAWIPSTKDRAVASTSLLSGDQGSAEPDRISPWSVTALPLDIGQSAHLL